MISLLMCGGRGTRLGRGEKPLFEVCGMRLIDHSINALKRCRLIGVTSPFTPRTEEYLIERGYEVYRAKGIGFIEDYRECIISLSLKGPLLIVSADLVYLRDGIIDEILEFYSRCGGKSLKVVKDGKPVGINIVVAEIEGEQDEESYIVNEVINVNTPEDAERAEKLWISMKKG